VSFVTTRTRAKKGSGAERKASLTIRIDRPTERALSALAVREGRTVSDVARRLLRVGIDTYEPEDKRPPVPNTRKIAAIAGVAKNDTIKDVAERLKELAGDAKLPPEQDEYLRMMLDKVAHRSSLVGEGRRPHEGPDDAGTMVAAYGMPPR
jgi:antitoxin component of RelBE/YafQ-DinJ toxin-antitoxin module